MEDRKFTALLGEIGNPVDPFQIISMDITGPYPLTPRKNKYLLTFIDNFTKYVEAFRIQNQTADSCARVYVSQIVTRLGSGSKLITNQGSAFVSFLMKRAKCWISTNPLRPATIQHPTESLNASINVTHSPFALFDLFAYRLGFCCALFNGLPRYTATPPQAKSVLPTKWKIKGHPC